MPLLVRGLFCILGLEIATVSGFALANFFQPTPAVAAVDGVSDIWKTLAVALAGLVMILIGRQVTTILAKLDWLTSATEEMGEHLRDEANCFVRLLVILHKDKEDLILQKTERVRHWRLDRRKKPR